jgi:periplasmic protein CpxP/Spy
MWVAIGLLVFLNLATVGWVTYRVRQLRTNLLNPERLLENRLDLSPEQQARFRELRADFRQVSQPYQDSLKRGRAELFGKLPQTVSDAELNALTSQLERQSVQLMRLRFRHWQQIRTLCTPQQQTRFDRMVERFRNQPLSNNNF